jgi:hypothetical protein
MKPECSIIALCVLIKTMVYFTFTKEETKRNNSKKPCHEKYTSGKVTPIFSLPTQHKKKIETEFVRPAILSSSVLACTLILSLNHTINRYKT